MASLDITLQGELKKYLAQQVAGIETLADQVDEVSEYIVLLISNGRSPEETLKELNSLFESDDLPALVQNAYQALENYKNNQNQAAQQQAEAQSQSNTEQESNGNGNGNGSNNNNDNEMIPEKPVVVNGIPTRPASLGSRIGSVRSNNGIGKTPFKNGVGPSGRSYATKNADNLQRAMELSGIPTGARLNKKGRCHKFPHCPFQKDCKYAHPTKPCFQYPNCPNPPGTCNFLHPGEDDELIKELEVTKNEYFANKQQSNLLRSQAGISICKFGILCTNLQCPFGHPTPANEDAKVIQLEWCPQNLKCEDPNCQKGHSSLSKIREVKPLSSGAGAAPGAPPAMEKSLEACKFGMNCTNRHCKYRHARSTVLCREGENCTRIDCLFSHPINENCRFDVNCKNPNCLFKHPNGKQESGPAVTSMKWTKTDERQFAVPEDQILEQAPPQEETL